MNKIVFFSQKETLKAKRDKVIKIEGLQKQKSLEKILTKHT